MSASSRPTGPFDAGLQLERTSLSWRRTALSVAVGSLVSLRLLPAWLGGAEWVIPGMVGLLLAGALWIGSRRRHEAFMLEWSRGDEPRIGSALPLMLIAAGAACVGALGLIAVLVSGR
jgi:hypothetical protein